MDAAGSDDEPWDLLNTHFLTKALDRDLFIDAFWDFYRTLAASWGCEVELSDRRLGDAHDFWIADFKRTEVYGIDEPKKPRNGADVRIELDHIKHASIIAFWLRRLVPINTTNIALPKNVAFDANAYAPDSDQGFFLQYGNELCALLAGFYISLNYQLQLWEHRVREDTGQDLSGRRPEIVRQFQLHDRVLDEYPKLLKHKNISWHALYMTYRALFDGVQLPAGR
jgi:hypothetical protein